MPVPYIGRFAPSPSGPLHDGSLAAGMASFLDAKAHRGKWLLRIENIDTPRIVKGSDLVIMQQLHALGMRWDGEVIWQNQRLRHYQSVFEQLIEKQLVYGCSCSRKEIADRAIALGRHAQGQYPYPGTCRQGTLNTVRSWRLKMPSDPYSFHDRWLGHQRQNIQEEIGDIIIKRADGLFAYQFVVVVDDADQGITDIVRGQDLLDSTQRQMALMDYLGYPPLRYLHIPLVLDANGRKLSKQNHAQAIDTHHALNSLERAWLHLGFNSFKSNSITDFWQKATARWAHRFSL